MAAGIDIVSASCKGGELCSYLITGQGFDPSTGLQVTGSTFTISFSTYGPEQYNEAPNTLASFSVNGSPAAGWVASTYGQTSYGDDGAIFATFDDDSADGSSLSPVTYEFFGTDAFWATIGENIAFAPAIPNAPPSASSGAFFVFNSSGAQADPPCTTCTVSINASPAPEPASAALLAVAAGIFLLYRRRRRLAD
jgi:hypothetical protein